MKIVFKDDIKYNKSENYMHTQVTRVYKGKEHAEVEFTVSTLC